MAKVYVIQETNHQFSLAESFGELVFLSVDRRDDFHNISKSEHNERLIAHLRYGLREFDQEVDFVVPVGSPYMQAAVFWILGDKGVRRLNLLRWDNRDRVYIPLQLNLN